MSANRYDSNLSYSNFLTPSEEPLAIPDPAEPIFIPDSAPRTSRHDRHSSSSHRREQSSSSRTSSKRSYATEKSRSDARSDRSKDPQFLRESIRETSSRKLSRNSSSRSEPKTTNKRSSSSRREGSDHKLSHRSKDIKDSDSSILKSKKPKQSPLQYSSHPIRKDSSRNKSPFATHSEKFERADPDATSIHSFLPHFSREEAKSGNVPQNRIAIRENEAHVEAVNQPISLVCSSSSTRQQMGIELPIGSASFQPDPRIGSGRALDESRITQNTYDHDFDRRSHQKLSEKSSTQLSGDRSTLAKHGPGESGVISMIYPETPLPPQQKQKKEIPLNKETAKAPVHIPDQELERQVESSCDTFNRTSSHRTSTKTESRLTKNHDHFVSYLNSDYYKMSKFKEPTRSPEPKTSKEEPTMTEEEIEERSFWNRFNSIGAAPQDYLDLKHGTTEAEEATIEGNPEVEEQIEEATKEENPEVEEGPSTIKSNRWSKNGWTTTAEPAKPEANTSVEETPAAPSKKSSKKKFMTHSEFKKRKSTEQLPTDETPVKVAVPAAPKKISITPLKKTSSDFVDRNSSATEHDSANVSSDEVSQKKPNPEELASLIAALTNSGGQKLGPQAAAAVASVVPQLVQALIQPGGPWSYLAESTESPAKGFDPPAPVPVDEIPLPPDTVSAESKTSSSSQSTDSKLSSSIKSSSAVAPSSNPKKNHVKPLQITADSSKTSRFGPPSSQYNLPPTTIVADVPRQTVCGTSAPPAMFSVPPPTFGNNFHRNLPPAVQVSAPWPQNLSAVHNSGFASTGITPNNLVSQLLALNSAAPISSTCIASTASVLGPIGVGTPPVNFPVPNQMLDPALLDLMLQARAQLQPYDQPLPRMAVPPFVPPDPILQHSFSPAARINHNPRFGNPSSSQVSTPSMSVGPKKPSRFDVPAAGIATKDPQVKNQEAESTQQFTEEKPESKPTTILGSANPKIISAIQKYVQEQLSKPNQPSEPSKSDSFAKGVSRSKETKEDSTKSSKPRSSEKGGISDRYKHLATLKAKKLSSGKDAKKTLHREKLRSSSNSKEKTKRKAEAPNIHDSPTRAPSNEVNSDPRGSKCKTLSERMDDILQSCD